jgi:AraC family transcriptional regulator of adaptative response / DNA-3-methyladenine glycosylase II
VLFAKQLIAETDMPLAHVALASGFGSVRRFNAVFQKLYRRPPGQFRRAAERPPSDKAGGGEALVLMLPFAPPYDWAAMLAALAARLDSSVEQVENGVWHRTITLGASEGSVAVGLCDQPGALRATIRFPDVTALTTIVRRIRRVFDLSADPIVIGKQLADDSLLAPLVRKRPGLRVPGPWEDFTEADDGRASYDAFDPENARLRAAIARLTGRRMISPDALAERAERWRPWRAYAVAQLLAGAADPTETRATPGAPARRLARAC